MPILDDPERMLALSNYLYILAGVIALSSTFAIVYFGSRVSAVKEQQLRAYQKEADARIADANFRAAQANEGAAKANEEVAKANATAANANVIAGTANQRAEEATAIAEKSRLDKAKIEHDNLILQQQLEKEKAARLQIERALAPRNLTLQAQQTMIAELKSLQQGKVDFVTYGGNAEADNLMKQIAFGFQAANWSMGSASPISGSASGVTIKFDPHDEGAANAAGIVQRALGDSGIFTTVIPTLPPSDELGAYASGGTFGQAKIRIYVGSK